MKSYFLIGLTLLLFGCVRNKGKYENIDFDNAICKISKAQKSSWIFVGVPNFMVEVQKKGIDKFISKYKDYYNFYFCDLSKQENEHINFIYQLDALPTAILMSPQKEVLYQSTNNPDEELFIQIDKVSREYIDKTNFGLVNENFRVKGDSLTRLYALTYEAYQSLGYQCLDSLKAGLVQIDKSIEIEPYFYNYYLGYKLSCKISADSIANRYKQKALSWFEAANAPLYTLLASELLQQDSAKQARIEFETNTMDFGKIPINQSTQRTIKYTNIGNAPLVIINALTSCGCVKANWSPRPLLPGQSSEMQITYNEDTGEENSFARTIIFITNTQTRNEILNIKGEISL